MRYRVVDIKWDGRANVCSSCGKVPENCYIATSHDHTDELAHMCNCGAGILFKEFFKTVSNPSRDLSSFSKYL